MNKTNLNWRPREKIQDHAGIHKTDNLATHEKTQGLDTQGNNEGNETQRESTAGRNQT